MEVDRRSWQGAEPGEPLGSRFHDAVGLIQAVMATLGTHVTTRIIDRVHWAMVLCLRPRRRWP